MLKYGRANRAIYPPCDMNPQELKSALGASQSSSWTVNRMPWETECHYSSHGTMSRFVARNTKILFTESQTKSSVFMASHHLSVLSPQSEWNTSQQVCQGHARAGQIPVVLAHEAGIPTCFQLVLNYKSHPSPLGFASSGCSLVCPSFICTEFLLANNLQSFKWQQQNQEIAVSLPAWISYQTLEWEKKN